MPQGVRVQVPPLATLQLRHLNLSVSGEKFAAEIADRFAGLLIGSLEHRLRLTPGVVRVDPVAIGALTHPGILA